MKFFKRFIFKKKTGILYDNFSGNTGDNAIGLSLRKILSDIKIDYDEIREQDTGQYRNIIIGGGLLLRETPDVEYDKFRIKGKHILNCMGLYKNPADLDYLNNYKYITVRSNGDKYKLSCLSRQVHVVPCTTMILEDVADLPFIIKKPAVGVHLFNHLISDETERKKIVDWTNNIIKQGFTVYFIPITLYLNNDQHLRQLSSEIPGSIMLPVMNPLEILTFIGKLDYLISCSLHGAIFSYVRNVPFLLYNCYLYNNDEKMKFFMEDRNLEDYLFYTFVEMEMKFNNLLNNSIDYSNQIIIDKQKIKEHIYRLAQILK